jgi:phosphoribosylformimino-5-aminoimidazole carboxamide ribotide isomerase
MIILPAIDLYEECAVRLLKGDYAQKTIYSESPIDVARDFEASGATCIHMVDLEGARDGGTPNIAIVEQVAKETSLFVEIGGGIRDMQTVKRYLDAGVQRVILGTAAVKDRVFLEEAVREYGEHVAVGADVREGKIAIKGWLETAPVTLDGFLQDMQNLGIDNVICTDISKDGAMQGTNLELYKQLIEKYEIKVTASGGVSSIEDVAALRSMGAYAAIIGKAYYTGAIDLKEALEVAK